MRDSILDVMSHGGGAMWLILAFSIIAVGVAVERIIAQFQFTTRARALADTVGRCLHRGAASEGRSACERSPSPLADVFLVGYERHGRVRAELVATAVHRERQRVTGDLRSRLWILGTIGALAPFVGLAGTVLGIMDAMGGWEDTDQVKFSMISGPISDALIATAAGIIVAIEAVIFFNYFSQRSSRIATEMKLLTDEFLEQLIEVPAEAPAKDAGKTTKGGSDGREVAA
jgi:biopolymer transport protein ExbB/TolQ